MNSQQSLPSNLQASKTQSQGKANISTDQDLSLDSSTLKSSAKQESNIEKSVSFNEDTIDLSESPNNVQLTGKQKQYLKDAICDNTGEYNFLADPDGYKKARKRLQNRESAVRSRQRNKNYQTELEALIEEQNQIILGLNEEKKQLKEENAALSSENSVLKQQLSYFQETFANSGVIENDQNLQLTTTTSSLNKPGDDVVRKDDLCRLEAAILSKVNESINQKLNQKEPQDEKKQLQPRIVESDHIIRPDRYKYYDDILLDQRRERESLEDIMASESYDHHSHHKRQRIHSSDEELDRSLILQRKGSSLFQGNSLMFLAVIACVVCYTSLGSPAESPMAPIINTYTGKAMKSLLGHLDNTQQHQNLHDQSVEDQQLTDEQIQKLQQRNHNHHFESYPQDLLKNLYPSIQVYGQYVYLVMSVIGFTCFVCSFFKWLLPSLFGENQNIELSRVHQKSGRKSRKESRRSRKYLPDQNEAILDI